MVNNLKMIKEELLSPNQELEEAMSGVEVEESKLLLEHFFKHRRKGE